MIASATHLARRRCSTHVLESCNCGCLRPVTWLGFFVTTVPAATHAHTHTHTLIETTMGRIWAHTHAHGFDAYFMVAKSDQENPTVWLTIGVTRRPEKHLHLTPSLLKQHGLRAQNCIPKTIYQFVEPHTPGRKTAQKDARRQNFGDALTRTSSVCACPKSTT